MTAKAKPAKPQAKPSTHAIPTARLTLGGRERVLRLDFNALAAAEDVRGKSYMTATALTDLSFGDVRALIYGCLLHESPDLTADEVGTWLRLDQMGEIGAAIGQLFTAFMPAASEDAGTGPLDHGDAAA